MSVKTTTPEAPAVETTLSDTAAVETLATDHQKLEQHELGKRFPRRSQDEFDALAKNIEEHGLLEPVVLHEGKVLDGWHRYEACLKVEQPVRAVSPDIPDPWEYVISRNYHRRHLNTSQRALIAAESVNSKKGGDRKTDQTAKLQIDPEVTQADAARRFAVSGRTIADACKVLAEAEAEVVECVRDGEAAVSDAVKVVADAPEHQTRAVALLAEGKAKSLTEGVRLSKAEHDAMPGVDGSGEVKRPASPPVEAPAAVRSPVDDATDEAKAPEQTKAPAADDSKQTGVAASTAPDAKPKTKREGGDDSTDDRDDYSDVHLRPVKDGRKVVLEVVRCDDESEPQANMVPIYWQVHDAIRQVAGKDYKRLLPYV